MRNKHHSQLFFFIFFVFCISVRGQTPVTGGIFSNTTWSLAGSPYIVTDTVAVFPGDTLTIQPGVIVKFNNNGKLWIKQGTLKAEGTTTDSITFTSNAASPAPGNWDGILVYNSTGSKFNFCKILYSMNGLYNTNQPIILKNSRFSHNQNGGTIGNSGGPVADSCLIQNNVYGIYAYGKISHSRILNNQYGLTGATGIADCVVKYNSVYGVSYSGGTDSILRSQIANNGIGIQVVYGGITITKNTIEYNNIGIELDNDPYPQSIFCNKICSNSAYDLKYLNTIASRNFAGNYWCTSDSAVIATHIYDGHDNVSYMLAYYTPLDDSCYLTTGIQSPASAALDFLIYPNPATDYLNIDLPQNNSNVKVVVYNSIGSRVIYNTFSGSKSTLPISQLPDGIYLIEILAGDKVGWQKLIKN